LELEMMHMPSRKVRRFNLFYLLIIRFLFVYSTRGDNKAYDCICETDTQTTFWRKVQTLAQTILLTEARSENLTASRNTSRFLETDALFTKTCMGGLTDTCF
jgi:hypothetical protein